MIDIKTATKGMTEGNCMKLLVQFFLPILAGNFFQQFYNLVDSAILGKFVSEQALAAAAACFSLSNVFIFIANGYGIGASNILMPLAGLVSGWGGIMTAAAPYLGEFGLPAVVMGNLMQGTSSAALSAYQNVSSNILSNADTILSNKVRNIETVCKMLDTQGEIVRKMLKESIDSDSKAIQNL